MRKIIACLLLYSTMVSGQMLTMTKAPTSNTNIDRSSAVAWTNPGNVQPVDDTYTRYTADGTTAGCDYLTMTTYGFTIPNESILAGIQFTGVGFTTASPVRNCSFRLQNHSPSFIGTAQSVAFDALEPTQFQFFEYINDYTELSMWDATLYAWQVRQANFGLRAYITTTNTNGQYYDFEDGTLAIHYFPPPARVIN